MGALRRLAPSVLADLDTIPEAYKPAMRFGSELYAYFLSVSSPCLLEMANNTTILQDAAFAFSKIAQSGYTGAILGCSDALFSLIPEVVDLLRRAKRLTSACQAWKDPIVILQNSFSPEPIEEAASLALEAELLLAKVTLWDPPEPSDKTFPISGKICQLALTALLAEASFRCVVAGGNGDNGPLHPVAAESSHEPGNLAPGANFQSQTIHLVTESLSLLDLLPVQSWVVTTMCWPIAVLGSYATLQAHRSTIRQYLMDMEVTFGFQNMARTRMLLEYIWPKIDTFETDWPIDIAEAMSAIGGRFMLG